MSMARRFRLLRLWPPAALIGLFLSLAPLAVNAGNAAADNVLNIYNWADYIDPALIEEFEREFDIRVN